MDAFRAEVAEWMRRHGEQWIGGETFRTLALTEWRGWTEGMSLAEEQKQWKKYLAGVSEARHGQWGDNCTIVAISGLLKRMIVVLSVGESKKLSLFEIEPPDHLSEGESCGVPLVISHYGAHHYMPVRVKKDGPWGWVMSPEKASSPANEQNVVAEGQADASPANQRLTSSRNPFPQRFVLWMDLCPERLPMTGRISSPQRRLVAKGVNTAADDARVGTFASSSTLRPDRTRFSECEDPWWTERALSLARGADSEEEKEWLAAWGIVRRTGRGKEKATGRDGGGSREGYSGRATELIESLLVRRRNIDVEDCTPVEGWDPSAAMVLS